MIPRILQVFAWLIFSLLPVSALAQLSAEPATVYSIDSKNSILRVFVGRAGILARLGHNHVIHTRSLSGEIRLSPDLLDSRGGFSFPVNSLIVDDPAERERAGDEFDSQPNESAIAGTRENMLGEEVLHARAFPEISVVVAPLSSSGEQWLLAVAISFQGRTHNQEIPADIVVDETSMQIQASFTLQHDDLGLSPFTAVGGSLRVAEALDFELSLLAQAQ